MIHQSLIFPHCPCVTNFTTLSGLYKIHGPFLDLLFCSIVFCVSVPDHYCSLKCADYLLCDLDIGLDILTQIKKLLGKKLLLDHDKKLILFRVNI